jgi:hypothetical protein
MTLEVTKHEVETITYETRVWNDFSTVTMRITDIDGIEMEIKLFANELKKLNFINEGIEVMEKVGSSRHDAALSVVNQEKTYKSV